MPVLAYGVVPEATAKDCSGPPMGACLVAWPNVGPVWITTESDSCDHFELFVGREPSSEERNSKPIGWEDATHQQGVPLLAENFFGIFP